MEPVQASVAGNDEPFEPCPTPLSWQDVLRQFKSLSDQRTVNIDGAVVTLRSIGTGPPLYLLSGLTGDSDLLSLSVWLIRETHQCVLLEFPTDFRPKSPDEIGALLLAIAEANGHRTFSVFSTGFGCVAALTAMRIAPQRITAAILHGAFARCELSVFERTAAAVGRFLPGAIGSIPGVKRIFSQNHRPWFPPFDESRWSFAESNLSATPISGLARRASILSDFDFSAQLDRLKTPILLVRCEGDSPIQVTAQDQLEQSIPGVSVEWLHTCGRLPFLTHPHRLKRIVLDFLAKHSGT